MRKYDHLFFDLDNTLWDFSANSKLAMKQCLEFNGVLKELESFDAFFSVYEQINTSLWRDYHTKKITKQNLIAERFSESLKQFGIINRDWQLLNNSYLEFMALQTVLFDGTIYTLDKLKAKGYQMHIITNGFVEVQNKKLQNCGLSGYFNKVFISEEIQTNKPHHQIFAHALKSTNAQKKKSVMIGDSWETDIEGALHFGMDQIMFLNQNLHAISPEISSMRMASDASYLELKKLKRTYFIQNIPDLLMIL